MKFTSLFIINVLVVLLAACQFGRVQGGVIRKIFRETGRVVTQAGNVLTGASGHTTTTESVDGVVDKPMEISTPQVSHTFHNFVAKNPEEFVTNLEQRGVRSAQSEFLKHYAFGCFASKNTDVKVWLPSNSDAVIQVLHVRTLERDDNSLDVSAVVLTATAQVTTQQDVLKRRVSTQFFNNRETSWKDTRPRGMTIGESATLFDVLRFAILSYPQLSEIGLSQHENLSEMLDREQVIA